MSLPTFCFSTTADEVAAALAAEIQGKNVLVTGTSLNGIGFDTARVIAKHANLVIITGYNLERLKLSEEAIKRDVPSANIHRLILDLSSLASVRKAAAEVNASPEPLHVLINNAAGGSRYFKLTADNLESQMATSHIGPFLLTKLLAPKLLATETTSYVPRVVFVSSAVHASGKGVNFSTLGRPEKRENYELMGMYSQVKSANVLTAIELSKRSKGRINAYSLHPGMIYTNPYLKEENIPDLKARGILTSDGLPNTEKFPFKTLAQGAATTIAAAFDPRLNDKPGAYLVDSMESNKDRARHSSDPANAEKLWDVTEEIIGEKFTF
ncbi:hypothetical protein DFH09DRAFT_1362962 [Mycena vulgaris]|nr:hypothetical protein DFH09DRAFT_1362962 [Mycena vulgaris]